MAELYHMAADAGQPVDFPDALPQVRNLAFKGRVELIIRQLQHEVASIEAEVTSGRTAIQVSPELTLGKLVAPSGKMFDASQRRNLANQHVEILTQLVATDFRLGKSYAVGVGLGETVNRVYKIVDSADAGIKEDDLRANLEPFFREERADAIIGQLKDLKTSFQPYAVDAVSTTFADWAKWFRSPASNGADWKGLVRSNWYPQGMIWRGQLSGEKLPTDSLQVPAYARAVAHQVRDYANLAKEILGRAAFLTAAVVSALLALAIAGGAVFLAITGRLEAIVAAIVATLSLIGIPGGAVAGATRRALNQAQDHLWKAELAYAVALAIDKTPVRPADSSVEALHSPKPEPPRRSPSLMRRWIHGAPQPEP